MRSGPPPPATRFAGPRRLGWIASVLVLLGAVGLAVTVDSRSAPEFPSLQHSPDTALHGTVAFVDSRTGCVRVLSASGMGARDVLCTAVDVTPGAGAPAQETVALRWTAADRLNITAYRARQDGTWQRLWSRTAVADSGDVATDEAPSADAATDAPGAAIRDETGRTVSVFAVAGRVGVEIAEDGIARRLLDLSGSNGYRIVDAFWSPDAAHVYATDSAGRVLVITTDEHPQVRTLVAHAAVDARDGAVEVAATGDDLPMLTHPAGYRLRSTTFHR